MSLRVRLLLGIAMLVSLVFAAGGVFVVFAAPRKVETEIVAATAATTNLFKISLAALVESTHIDQEVEALVRAMAHVRHVRVGLYDADGKERAVSPEADTGAVPVPLWFSALVRVTPTAVSLPVVALGKRIGTVVVESDPRKELYEAWQEVQYDLAALSLISLGAGFLIYVVTGRALRPLGTLATAMGRIEAGDYGARIPAIPAPELDRLGKSFNHMADRLAAMATDNRQMAERLVSLQEEERAELARDLHDDIGPSLFAVNLDASAIARAARAAHDRETAERAGSILEVVAHIQGQVRTMLNRLKPSGLEEFGLAGAVQGLAEFWRRRHPEVAWRLTLPAEGVSYGRTIDVTAFRIVQEAAINALRHGHARSIEVKIAPTSSVDGTGDLAVTVCDDGGGLDDKARTGFGLVGMNERIRALGGSLDVVNRAGEGLTVSARLPVAEVERPEEVST